MIPTATTPTKAQLSDLDALVENLRDLIASHERMDERCRARGLAAQAEHHSFTTSRLTEAADALVALKAELDRVEQERDRAFEALHPGPMPNAGMIAAGSGVHSHGQLGDWCDSHARPEHMDWCRRANLYERITGKRIGDEG